MKEVNVKVIFGDHSFGSHVAMAPDGLVVYLDQIQADKHNLPLWAIAAHEFGHVVGHLFTLPAHTDKFCIIDPLPREREAWNMAEIAMGMTRVKEYSLDHYEKHTPQAAARTFFTYDTGAEK